ncbi:S23 ribosomal protein [Bacteroidetes bacterium UKL13-3]|jgi:four helix bundle protein|nr:S23 ribosomal protein [Bacteroidetes bacterium UKL13-3]HCP94936.1 four helix bundle protein [Bacteroidota bacterium]
MYGSFEDLEVWKQCRVLRQMIFILVKKFPTSEKFTLTDQILRSSRSPCANIAEGHGRFHYQQNSNFCRIARGSLTETLNHLSDALDCEYIANEEFLIHKDHILHCIKILNGYILYLKKKKDSDD